MSVEKKKTKPFQIIVIGISVVLLIVAVFVFSQSDQTKKNTDGGVNYGDVVVWGTVPMTPELAGVFGEFNTKHSKMMTANYVYVPEATLDQTLLEAIGNDQGPDALILPNEWLHRNILRIAPTPYDPQKGGVSTREFKDSFTQAGEIFLYPEGIMAFPLAIDPLVLYWNRDLFTDASIVAPPVYWKDIIPLTAKLTKKKNLDILQSTIALGEYENVVHAKDILALMFLQVESPITEFTGGVLSSVLAQNPSIPQAVRFYADFANPLKSNYSWNRSLPNSQDSFLAGNLAMYIDFASMFPTLQAKNPRLNFDLAPAPQTDGARTAITYGKTYGVAVMKKGKNVPGAQAFTKMFSSRDYVDLFAKATGMAPMRRDLLAIPQSDAFLSTLYDAGLKARAWTDPQPVKTNEIFSRMIDAVTSGKTNIAQAITQANTEMNTLLGTK